MRGWDLVVAALVVVGCDADAAETGVSALSGPVAEAAAEIPDYLTLHTRVIARTCGPDGGVCHNGKEYPDLHTPANMLDAVLKACNAAETEFADVADLCEDDGDFVTLLDGAAADVSLRIAWHEVVGDAWEITLEREVPGACASYYAAFRIDYGDGSPASVIDVAGARVEVTCGSRVVTVPAFTDVDATAQTAILRRVRMGDRNRNGVFGASHGGALIVPGDPDKSYLLQRIFGTVPGTPMPLGNQPLDDYELLALTCWIETVGDPPVALDPIDWGSCAKAADVAESGVFSWPAPLEPEEPAP